MRKIMNFNQKILALITFLALAITCGIAFTCYEPPYSNNFWIAISGLLLSEIVFGITLLLSIAKKNNVLPMALGAYGINILYLLFTIIMTLFTNMETRFFMLTEAVGLAVIVIAHLIFKIVEHHVDESSNTDAPEQKIEKTNITWR